MIRKIVLVYVSVCSLAWSLPAFSANDDCPPAVATKNPNFCGSFITAATCRCNKAGGIPKEICGDIKKIYKYMISYYGSQQRACAIQKETTPRICEDDWNCFWKGGEDSNHNPCSGNKKACMA